jgi:hypothetical protein
MSLVKSPVLTPQKLAANQANGRQSEGPTSPEGIERIAEAHLQHGFYSQRSGDAIRALGEKPEDFERLQASLIDTWQPASDYELALVHRLARSLWRLERADRIQEAMTVCQAEIMAQNVEANAEEDQARYKEKLAVLERVLHSAQFPDFTAGAWELEVLAETFGEKPLGRQKEINYRAFRLVSPEAVPSQLLPFRGMEPAQGEERNRLRAELCSLLRQEIEALSLARRQERDKTAKELSPAMLDSYLAPSHPRAAFMLRVENAAFHQVEHTTQLLMRLQQSRGQVPKGIGLDDGKSHDVVENKGSGSVGER